MVKITLQDNIDYSTIASKIDKGIERRKKLLTAAVLQDSNYYVPQDTGTLQKSGINATVLDNGVIKWDASYARKIYYSWREGLPNSHNRNPNARAKWFEAAKAERLDEWLGIMEGLYGTN